MPKPFDLARKIEITGIPRWGRNRLSDGRCHSLRTLAIALRRSPYNLIHLHCVNVSTYAVWVVFVVKCIGLDECGFDDQLAAEVFRAHKPRLGNQTKWKRRRSK